MAEQYVYKDQKKLRCGYTTGSCAAAAAKAATKILLSGEEQTEVALQTPKGTTLMLRLAYCNREQKNGQETVTCAIQKDSGDDADVTNGVLVYAEVCKQRTQITIDGGVGIGRVTLAGLDQPVGNAAINSVPRSMITQEVREMCEQYAYKGGIQVVISIPEGVAIAKKTFNPRLGIVDGISILGTSGIVEPMSEQALVDTIRTEMRQKTVMGQKNLLVVPGNYGEAFLKESLEIDAKKALKCSNFIGDTIDMAYEYQVKSLLLVGHIGKLIKLGAGIMNTHSKMADGRMEVLASCAIRTGADNLLLNRILDCATTEEALLLLKQEKVLPQVMQKVMEQIEFYLTNRAYEGLTIAAITFSSQRGLLGKTSRADELLKIYHKEQELPKK